jgi:hypothetical protein
MKLAEHPYPAIHIREIFTWHEIDLAVQIYLNDEVNFHRRAVHEIIEPVMDRIELVTSQKNSAAYLAYALEYACSKGQL